MAEENSLPIRLRDVPDASNAPTDFPKFSELAAELRRMIWKAAVQPRLVHWRPGGAKAPALLLTCKESREEMCAVYVLCFDVFRRIGTYALFIARDIDTIYCKNGLPNITPMKHITPFPVEYAVPEGKLGRGMNVKGWTHGIKNLMVDLDEASTVYSKIGDSGNLNIWKKLKEMCPDLEVLNIAIFPRIRKHHELHNLTEILHQSIIFPNSGLTHSQYLAKQRFVAGHQKELAKGKFLGLVVKFVKLAPTASLAKDAPLKVREGEPGSGEIKKGYHRARFSTAHRPAPC